jgi:pseudouridine-5'-phosphate glycosidase
MNQSIFKVSQEISEALRNDKAVVALESTVITHGLPYPHNYDVAQKMEQIIRENNAIPATIAVIDGDIHVGLEDKLLKFISREKNLRKVSVRDYGLVLSKKISGGTTVAGTLVAASAVGIPVFATGGIGGVHRGNSKDISTDMIQLSKTPVIVVCAGAKSILDLPATVELLETLGVPVLGYKTDEFPAFYSRESGLKTSATVYSPEEVSEFALAHWAIGIKSAVLLVVPPPEEFALSKKEMEKAIDIALKDAEELKISGQSLTPYLLSRVSKLTDGSSLQANLALLENNANIAAKVSVAFKIMHR